MILNISNATMLRKPNAFDLTPNMDVKKKIRIFQYVADFAIQVQVLAKPL